MKKDINTSGETSIRKAQEEDPRGKTMGTFGIFASLAVLAAGLYFATAQSSIASIPEELPAQTVVSYQCSNGREHLTIC